jgi:hypothetical protein
MSTSPETPPTSDVAVRKVKSAVRTVALLEYLAARQDRPARIREISAALECRAAARTPCCGR